MYEFLKEMALIENAYANLQQEKFNIHKQFNNEVPDILIRKIGNKVHRLQTLQVLESSKQSVVDFVKLALRGLDSVDMFKANIEMIAESIGDIVCEKSDDFKDYKFDPSKDEDKTSVMQYAKKIVKKCKCDSVTALAYALRDCEPDQCELPEKYQDHVKMHFNDDEIAEVGKSKVNETTFDDDEQNSMSNLSTEEKEQLKFHAAAEVRKQRQAGTKVDVYEILGNMIENIPGLEFSDVNDVFNEEDIRWIITAARSQ